jgi:membrane-associated phospholipid phosphatase
MPPVPHPRRRVGLTLEALEGRALLSKGVASPGGDVVVAWNAAALGAIRINNTPPPVAARDLAILQLAVDEAVVVAQRNSPAVVSPEAAVAGAADRVLDQLFPAQAAGFDAMLAGSLAGGTGTPAQAAGVALGRSAADVILASRSNDGSNATVPYTPSTATGLWRPTPPGFAPALLPQWPGVTPFVLRSGSQFRPPVPPALTSRAYAASLSQVERLGRANSTARTPDQTQIANFWADGTGTATPPGHWNEIAEAVASSRHLCLARTAQLFAVLDAALADAGIACWDAKFAYNFWRPITAIQLADTDGNPRTVADPSWTPLLATPPFPTYVSGHSTFSAAAATVLSAFFGPNTHFRIGSDAMPGVTRTFRSFDEAAAEAGMSRIYGGIHYSFDNTAGQALGRAVGRYVLGHFPVKPGR